MGMCHVCPHFFLRSQSFIEKSTDTFTLPRHSETIIVLSQSDDRFYRGVAGLATWTFDFKLYKQGDTALIGSSSFSFTSDRSRSLHAELDAGDYVVHVRLNRDVDKQKVSAGVSSAYGEKKISLALTELARSRSMAANFDVRCGLISEFSPAFLTK